MMSKAPLLSFVLATQNRAPTLLHTLHRIDACGYPRRQYEIFVVDNASTDDTASRLSKERPDVHLVALDQNRGSCSKALALPHTKGQYIILLDDDSYPLADSVERMVAHFQEDPQLGAAGFIAHLPDGRQECSALPKVFIGCGVGFRRESLMAVGGLDLSLFMAAEEYDLSFRLIQAGYDVKIFSDLHALHLKTPSARQDQRTILYDVRNNLILAATYLPSPWHREFMCDWEQRYCWLVMQRGVENEYQQFRWAGYLKGYYRRLVRSSLRLNDRAMETLFGIKHIASEMEKLKYEGYTSLLFADLGKNIYPYYRAAAECGMHVEAIMDDRFAYPQRTYRGIPIVPYKEGLKKPAEAIVISNSSPVHARRSEQRLASMTALPIHRWHGRYEFEPQTSCFKPRTSTFGAPAAQSAAANL